MHFLFFLMWNHKASIAIAAVTGAISVVGNVLLLSFINRGLEAGQTPMKIRSPSPKLQDLYMG